MDHRAIVTESSVIKTAMYRRTAKFNYITREFNVCVYCFVDSRKVGRCIYTYSMYKSYGI